MPKLKLPAPVVNFRARLTAFANDKARVTRALAFPRTSNSLPPTVALCAVFDHFSPAHPLPKQATTAQGINYWLTVEGDGLAIYHGQTGAVRGDAYTDFFTLLLPADICLSTETTEDSYQPEIVIEITAPEEAALAPVVEFLTAEMGKANVRQA